MCKVFVTLLSESPNQRYESWRMPYAHSPNGIRRIFRMAQRVCGITEDAEYTEDTEKTHVLAFIA